MYVSVVIPAFREEATIGEVVRRASPYADQIIVVCDDESDPTLEVALSHGAKVLHNKRGRGKGNAIRFAVDEIQSDILVLMDADGSHDEKDIPKMLGPIREGEADMVLGSRIKGGSEEFSGGLNEKIRLWAVKFAVSLTNRIYRSKLSDLANGFRAIRWQTAKELDLREPRFAIELEMVWECLKRGKRVVEIPTFEFRRKHGASRLVEWLQVVDCARCYIGIAMR